MDRFYLGGPRNRLQLSNAGYFNPLIIGRFYKSITQNALRGNKIEFFDFFFIKASATKSS